MSNKEYETYLDKASLLDGLADCPDLESDAIISPLINRLCRLYTELKEEQHRQPAVYLPGGEWANYIREQENIYSPLLKGDTQSTTTLFRNFWRNELGPVVKQYATYQRLCLDEPTREQFIDQMCYDYMIWSNLLYLNPAELTLPPIGNPWGVAIDGIVIAPKALRYHLLATQIKEITRGTRRPVVAEIGAGYGGTAHYLLRGTEHLTYIDFDLPEVLTIAAYYLSRTLPHRKILLWKPGIQINNTTLVENDVILLPNWMLPNLPDNSVDLFLNTFSLSEMPFEVIAEYIRNIERTCRGYFLYNNMDREGVLNRGHERVPCSKYPIPTEHFKQLYKRYDTFQRLHSGRDGDYREVLLQKIAEQ